MGTGSSKERSGGSGKKGGAESQKVSGGKGTKSSKTKGNKQSSGGGGKRRTAPAATGKAGSTKKTGNNKTGKSDKRDKPSNRSSNRSSNSGHATDKAKKEQSYSASQDGAAVKDDAKAKDKKPASSDRKAKPVKSTSKTLGKSAERVGDKYVPAVNSAKSPSSSYGLEKHKVQTNSKKDSGSVRRAERVARSFRPSTGEREAPRIDIEEIVFGNLIGEGAFGRTWEASWHHRVSPPAQSSPPLYALLNRNPLTPRVFLSNSPSRKCSRASSSTSRGHRSTMPRTLSASCSTTSSSRLSQKRATCFRAT
jgi:hypothetical protein